VVAPSAATVALVAKAAVSQTANLLELQNSSGTAITFFNSSGGLTATEGVISTLYSGGKMTTGTLGYYNATTFTPAVIPIVARGTTSQTADLQQWQNSAGTVLVKVDKDGNVTAVKFVTSGGTSSQFVKGDGSLDSSTYATADTAIATSLMLGGM
jgi:hypothetical protein